MAGQADQERVLRLIVEPMRKRFIAPKAADEEALLEDYVEDLAEFDEVTLKEAWTRVRRAAETRTWPSAGAFRKAALDVGRNPYITAGESEDNKPVLREVLKSPWGQKALQQGWGWDLWRFVEANKREPTEREADEIQRGVAKAIRRAAEMRENPGQYVAAERLMGLWRGMLKREERLKREYLR